MHASTQRNMCTVENSEHGRAMCTVCHVTYVCKKNTYQCFSGGHRVCITLKKIRKILSEMNMNTTETENALRVLNTEGRNRGWVGLKKTIQISNENRKEHS